MIDEPMAIEEIKGLSENARKYLSHVLRNHLQISACGVELKDLARIEDANASVCHELGRMRL